MILSEKCSINFQTIQSITLAIQHTYNITWDGVADLCVYQNWADLHLSKS